MLPICMSCMESHIFNMQSFGLRVKKTKNNVCCSCREVPQAFLFTFQSGNNYRRWWNKSSSQNRQTHTHWPFPQRSKRKFLLCLAQSQSFAFFMCFFFYVFHKYINMKLSSIPSNPFHIPWALLTFLKLLIIYHFYTLDIMNA